MKLLKNKKGLIKFLLKNHFDETVVGERYLRATTTKTSFSHLQIGYHSKKCVDGNWKITSINPINN